MLRILAVVILASALSACGPRIVQVETGAPGARASEVSLRVTNNLSQAVNIYITSGGSEVFVKQVGANTAEWIPVQGFSPGSVVTLRARTVDGARTYHRDNVTLENMYEWRVP